MGAMVLGSIVGGFLESAMLGACYVANSMYTGGEEGFSSDSRGAVIGIALWCIVTGAAAATICFMLRNLVWAVFVSTYDYETADVRSRRVAEKVMARLVKCVDAWFGAGCVLGMCSFWGLTYIALGMQEHIMQSFWVGLLASLIWFVMSRGAQASDSLDDIFTSTGTQNTGIPEQVVVVREISGKQKPMKRVAVDPPAIETAVPLLS